MYDAYNLAFDSAGNLFVAAGAAVIEITPGGVQSTFASGFQTYGLAFQVVPEPSTWAMLALGGFVLFGSRCKP